MSDDVTLPNRLGLRGEINLLHLIYVELCDEGYDMNFFEVVPLMSEQREGGGFKRTCFVQKLQSVLELGALVKFC
jgi:hypothetical protein